MPQVIEKIVIFGATGMTGLCATEAAINKELHVKVLVRDPSKLPDSLKDKVEVVEGNVLNYSDVERAIEGVDGVVVALGTRVDLSPTTDLSEGLKNIVKAMKTSGVQVVSVCLSAFLFHVLSGTDSNVPERFRDLTAEHLRMYDVLRESDLAYVAVFPPHIADQPPKSYHIEHDKHAGGRVVSKHDLGQFLVDSLTQPEHFRHVCGIISK